MGAFKLQRMGGPILQPCPENAWESRAVFNPGTVRNGEVIHMLYRAVEGENFSSIGYARLDREGKILEKRKNPVIVRELEIEKKGCEDPPYRVIRRHILYFLYRF